MENSELREKEINQFFRNSRTSFKRLPQEPVPKNALLNRAALFGMSAGLLDYVAIQQVPGLNRSGIRDEISVLLAATAGALIGRLQNVRNLCATESKERIRAKFNVVKSGAAGLGVGSAIAAILPAAAAAALGLPLAVLLGGVVAGGAGLGAGATALYNRATKQKTCPRCGGKGNCKQRVCRVCKRLFFPEDVELNCSKYHYLEWRTIASFLDQQGLSYLDAEVLVRECLSEWQLFPDETNGVRVGCRSFSEWVDHNEDRIAAYKGKGMQDRTDQEALEYLNKSKL
jgi:hypothetical protein